MWSLIKTGMPSCISSLPRPELTLTLARALAWLSLPDF
jgi:hypothetical protein